MISIIQPRRKNEPTYCYLCAKLRNDYDIRNNLEEHHVIHGKKNNRDLSEKYGLKVYLCREHHTSSKAAVHKNKDNDLMLKQVAQRVFIRVYPDLCFREIFGKNYIDTEQEEPKEAKEEFFRINEAAERVELPF